MSDKYYFLEDLGVAISETKFEKVKDIYTDSNHVKALKLCPHKEDAQVFIEKSTLKLWKRKPKGARSGAVVWEISTNGEGFWSNGCMKDEGLYSDEFIAVSFI